MPSSTGRWSWWVTRWAAAWRRTCRCSGPTWCGRSCSRTPRGATPPCGASATSSSAERVEGCREAARDLDAEVARGRLDRPAWPEAELRPWAESSAAFDLDFGATGRAALDVPWRDVAAALAVPTLVVTGTEEVIIDPSVRHELTALANDHLEIVVVPGAGHCVRRDQRAGFHEVVDPWIARHAG